MAACIRVGLVGLGDAARHHARALLALSESGALAWTAVCGRDPARIEAACAGVGAPAAAQRFTSLDALLSAGVCDAVVLATPDGLHAAQIRACAAHRVHVLTEKPLALAHEDGTHAVAAAQDAGIVLRVGYHLRHHAGHALVRAQLAAHIGTLRAIFVRWAWPDPATDGWRARGQEARTWSLAALGTHGIDLALWLADATLAHVAGLTAPPGDIDQAAEVSLRFQTGVLAHVSVAVTHRARSLVLLTGDRGEIECTGTLGARGGGELWLRPATPGATPVSLPFTPHDPYGAQLRAFLERIRAGGTDAGDTADALTNLQILDRIAPLAGR